MKNILKYLPILLICTTHTMADTIPTDDMIGKTFCFVQSNDFEETTVKKVAIMLTFVSNNMSLLHLRVMDDKSEEFGIYGNCSVVDRDLYCRNPSGESITNIHVRDDGDIFISSKLGIPISSKNNWENFTYEKSDRIYNTGDDSVLKEIKCE